MANKKLTRNSYKRKVILFGVLIFISIALISTGFAAWVMSTNSKTESNPGNISVGTVTDAKLTFGEIAISGKDIKFEPKEGDISGRVRVDDAGNVEQLNAAITGKVSPEQYLGELKAYLVVPESVYNVLTTKNYITLEKEDGTAMTTAELQNFLVKGTVSKDGENFKITEGAIDETKGIVLYSKSGSSVNNGSGNFTSIVSGTEVSFSVKIKFNWGTEFGGMNPSEYYDENETGLAKSDEEVKKILEDFRAFLFGYDTNPSYTTTNPEDSAARDDFINGYETEHPLMFKVIFTAKAN